jgi:hypothetical protein
VDAYSNVGLAIVVKVCCLSKWQMAFNADKCFFMRAGTKRKTIKQDYTIHNHILEVVEESKYLGVIVDPRLYLGAPLSQLWL